MAGGQNRGANIYRKRFRFIKTDGGKKILETSYLPNKFNSSKVLTWYKNIVVLLARIRVVEAKVPHPWWLAASCLLLLQLAANFANAANCCLAARAQEVAQLAGRSKESLFFVKEQKQN